MYTLCIQCVHLCMSFIVGYILWENLRCFVLYCIKMVISWDYESTLKVRGRYGTFCLLGTFTSIFTTHGEMHCLKYILGLGNLTRIYYILLKLRGAKYVGRYPRWCMDSGFITSNHKNNGDDDSDDQDDACIFHSHSHPHP